MEAVDLSRVSEASRGLRIQIWFLIMTANNTRLSIPNKKVNDVMTNKGSHFKTFFSFSFVLFLTWFVFWSNHPVAKQNKNPQKLLRFN